MAMKNIAICLVSVHVVFAERRFVFRFAFRFVCSFDFPFHFSVCFSDGFSEAFWCILAPTIEAKAAPGTPWEGQVSLQNFSGAPPEDSNEFWGGRRPPGANLAPKMVPTWSREASIFGDLL